MPSYQSFAGFYDDLTANIDYTARADYFRSLFCENGITEGILVDLGCGTGSMTEALARLGYDMIGIDASAEMLSAALEKKMDSGLGILYLQQEMQELDLYGTMDGCLCALDTLNHLTDPRAVQETFRRVSLFLRPGGIFVFDVNTPYKHAQVLKDQTFVYETDSVYCVWQNEALDEDLVQITLDLFSPDKSGRYRRETEQFCERAYSHETVCGFLEQAGLSLVACYHEDSKLPPRPDSERLVYVAKSKKTL